MRDGVRMRLGISLCVFWGARFDSLFEYRIFMILHSLICMLFDHFI